MILDSSELVLGAVLPADVCVVGAGPVGIALALALAGKGREVLLLEAGGTRHDPADQAIYAGEVIDPALHSPLDAYRERRLGGSTTIWGGRCMPFDPIDFRSRDWIPDSGWPIDRTALDPYYPAANALCEAGGFAYTAAEAVPGGRPMIAGFAGRSFTTDTLERFSRPTDFGSRYRAELAASPRVRLVLHANVVELVQDDGGRRVERVVMATRSGARIEIAARQVVLAMGGLETARLMLASNRRQPAGIGNDHDVLGRYYMCHLAGTIGTFRPEGGTAAIWNGYDVAADGTYCRRRLALTPAAQALHRTGNFVARLHHPRIADPVHRTGPLSALHLGRALVPRQFRKRLDAAPGGIADTVRHVRNVAADAPAVARFAWQMLAKRRLAARKYPSVVVVPRHGAFSLDFHAEQLPGRNSRVRLSTAARDRFGMPRLAVDWRYHAGDVATVRTALALLADDLAASGCGRFAYDEAAVEAAMVRDGAYPGHHIGTVRMGADPRTSMVDADARVHGIANLHVGGAAIFATSSQANPTLTAVALALRLADRLAAAG